MVVCEKTIFKAQTRKSSCVNARGIPSATYRVLAMLLCLLIGGGGYPIQFCTWGTPCPDLGPDQDEGYPPGYSPSRPRMGYPLSWSSDGVPPHPGPEMGIPPREYRVTWANALIGCSSAANQSIHPSDPIQMSSQSEYSP